MAPFEGWLLVRGMRTLDLRMRAHERRLERRRAACAGIRGSRGCCIPPSTASVDGLQLTGSSGLFSLELDGGIDVVRFCDGLRLFKLGVSWGGHESLVMPAAVVHEQAAAGPNSAIDFGVSPRTVRLHVGLEATAGSDRRPDAGAGRRHGVTADNQGKSQHEDGTSSARRWPWRCSPAQAQADTTLQLTEVITSPQRTELLKGMIAKFEAANPGVKVEVTSLPWGQAFEKLATMVQGGQIPDVVEMPERWLSLYANNGQLESLKPWIDKWHGAKELTDRMMRVRLGGQRTRPT